MPELFENFEKMIRNGDIISVKEVYHELEKQHQNDSAVMQMIKRIMPPMSNEIITLVKDTSLARIIALQELIWMGEAFTTTSHGISGQVWPLFFTGVYYLLFNGILTVVLGKLEKKLDYFKI